MSGRAACRHCRRQVTRGRCRWCDRVGGVPPRRDPRPTPALPGTPEKVAVLVARAEAGERLWHRADARHV